MIKKLYAIYKQFEEYTLKDDPKLKELKKIFGDFFNQDRYWKGHLSTLNKRNIMKETDLYRGDKSYTINKERVYLCLKDENKGEQQKELKELRTLITTNNINFRISNPRGLKYKLNLHHPADLRNIR